MSRDYRVNWLMAVNAIFACGNFWFAGHAGGMVCLAIGFGNLAIVVVEALTGTESI